MPITYGDGDAEALVRRGVGVERSVSSVWHGKRQREYCETLPDERLAA